MPRKRIGWFVYVLRCADGSLYAGTCLDFAARLARHNAGTGAKYVRSRLPAVLAWSVRAASESAARRREAAIKRLTKAAKEALVASAR